MQNNIYYKASLPRREFNSTDAPLIVNQHPIHTALKSSTVFRNTLQVYHSFRKEYTLLHHKIQQESRKKNAKCRIFSANHCYRQKEQTLKNHGSHHFY